MLTASCTSFQHLHNLSRLKKLVSSPHFFLRLASELFGEKDTTVEVLMLHPSVLCLGFTFLLYSQNHLNFWHEVCISARSKIHKWSRTQLPTLLPSHFLQSLHPLFHSAEILGFVWFFSPLFQILSLDFSRSNYTSRPPWAQLDSTWQAGAGTER